MGIGNHKIKKQGKGKNEQIIEAVEIEYIELNRLEYERRVCAMIKALLEIDERLHQHEDKLQISKEAA